MTTENRPPDGPAPESSHATRNPGDPDEPHDSDDLGDVEDAVDHSVTRTDPLLANPVLATGQTGQIPRPGDDRSPWVIGLLLAAFSALISGLVTIAIVRDDGATDEADAADTLVAADVTAASTEAGDDGAEDEPEVSSDPTASGPPESDPADTSTPTTEPSPVELDDRRLPAPGFAVLDGATVPIVSSCEVHLPLAPANNDVQVSSYSVRSAAGDPAVIDRRFEGDAGPVVLIGGVEADFVVVDSDEERGAFVADGADDNGADGLPSSVVVNPAAGGGTSCGDTLVTNEQGQLAFPHTRIVLVSCASGSLGVDLFATGLTSEGGRFSAQDNADGTVTLSYVDPETGSELLDPAASAFTAGDGIGFSGIVTNGAVTFDITIDVVPERGLPCSNAAQL